jgi:hypothetical protein
MNGVDPSTGQFISAAFPKARFRPQKRWVVAALLLCTSAPLLYWWNPGFVFRPQINWTVEDVEQLVDSEVPKKANRIEVEAFFDKHRIPHSWFDVDPGDFNDGTEAAKRAGLTKQGFHNWMRGDIFNAQVEFLIILHIHIYFFFDDKGRVITFLVREKVIGL